MSGRVTVKGKGAEIFFGEDPSVGEPATHEDATSTTGPVEAPTRAHPGVETPRRPDVTTSSSGPAQASASARGSDEAREFFERLTLPAALRRRFLAAFKEEHRFHTTIRLSREDMAALRDLCYELDARMGIAVTRNDVGRLALRLLLEDYALRKRKSLLVQILDEEKEQY